MFLRDRHDEEHARLVDGENAEETDEQDDDRADDHRFCADAIIEQAADDGADRAGRGEDDTEEAEIERAPSEDGSPIDAAENEDRREPVAVEHPRYEHPEDVAIVLRQVAHGVPERFQRVADRALGCRLERSFVVRHEKKERNHEQDEPRGAKRPDEAVAFAARLIEAEDRIHAEHGLAARGIRYDQPGDEREGHEPAGVAETP